MLSSVKTFQTSLGRARQPSGAVVIELKDAVLLRVGEVDASVDAVKCELLRRQEIMTAEDEAMHRAIHIGSGDTWHVEMTVRRLVALVHIEQQPTTSSPYAT